MPPRDIAFAPPREQLEFDGERCTPWVQGPVLSEHVHRYLCALDLCQGKAVLDIASGEGYGAAMLARNGAASVVGVEISDKMVERATRIYGQDGLRFQQGDIRQPLALPDDSIDVVVCFETLEHVDTHDGFLSELVRVMRPNATLVISTPDKALYSPGVSNPFHVKELTRDEFHSLLSRHFAHVELYHQGFLTGSVITAETPPQGGSGDGQTDGAEPLFFRRQGFQEYRCDTTPLQREYMIAIASGAAPTARPAALPTGMLHDGQITGSLHKRIRELESALTEARAALADLEQDKTS